MHKSGKPPNGLEEVDLPQTKSDSRDHQISSGLSALSQRVGRRSFLYKLGSSILGGVAMSLFAQPTAMAQPPGSMIGGGGYNSNDWHNCSDWNRCGMCGYSCNCCNGDRSYTQCPECAARANFWTACCEDPSGSIRRVRYTHCRKADCTNAKLRDCYDCSGCNDGCPERFWKQQDQTYVCTIVETVGAC